LLGLGAVVDDAALLPDVHVRVRSENAVAELALEAGHQRERDDERHHADNDAQRGNERDDGDERLLALGEQISERDVQLEGDIRGYSFFRIKRNRMTSRIDAL